MLCALGEAHRSEALQLRSDAVDIIGSDIEMHPILDKLLFRDALQYQRRRGRILRTKEKVGFKEADLLITERLRPEICERFRIIAIDYQVDVGLHPSLPSNRASIA
jgi:hypothetical protein